MCSCHLWEACHVWLRNYEMKEEKAPVQEGPIKSIDPAQVPKEPSPFAVEGFEWVTMNLDDGKEVLRCR